MEGMNITPDQYRLLLRFIELSAKGLIEDREADPAAEQEKVDILTTLGMSKEEALSAAEGIITH